MPGQKPEQKEKPKEVSRLEPIYDENKTRKVLMKRMQYPRNDGTYSEGILISMGRLDSDGDVTAKKYLNIPIDMVTQVNQALQAMTKG